MKPTPAQQFSIRSKAVDVALRLHDIKVPELKTWKPDDATLRAWARASDPYKREAGDGR